MEGKAKAIISKIGEIKHLFLPLFDTKESAIKTREAGIWLLPAGCRAGESENSYTKTINSLDWNSFYEEYGGFEFFEWLRRELIKDVDFVLVDSRTGLTEMGGICTKHLADIVLCFIAPNDSNLKGIHKIMDILVGDKLKKLRGLGRPINVFPIPTRVDTQGERDQLKQFEEKFRKTFESFNLNIDWCWESKIRYVTHYSYEEQIVFSIETGHPDLIRAYEKIGDKIVRLYEEKLSLPDREGMARYRASQNPKETPKENMDRSLAHHPANDYQGQRKN